MAKHIIFFVDAGHYYHKYTIDVYLFTNYKKGIRYILYNPKKCKIEWLYNPNLLLNGN